jgi:hypothetical protein
MNASPEPVFAHRESDLAETMDIAPEALKRARGKHLRRGLDWNLILGKVWYSDGARQRILEVLAPAREPAAAAVNSAPNSPAAGPDPKSAKPAPEGAADAFPHLDQELATRLGVGQKELRSIRTAELEAGVDWAIVAGSVRYSMRGLTRLLAALKIQAPELLPASTPIPGPAPAAPAANGAAPGARLPGALEDLTCGKVYRINKRMVEALTAAGEQVVVRVRDNTNLQPGMVMPCRFGGGRIWELNRRLPRRRGLW